MKKRIQSNKTPLEEFIDYYMEGNLQRFLRKHQKQHHFCLTYSITLKHVRKSNKKAYKFLKSEIEYPKHMSDCLNVFITLDKHFGIGCFIKNIKDYLVIEEELTEIIRVYMGKVRTRKMVLKLWHIDDEIPSREEAIKEQKARGFMHVNDFEDYKGNYAHILSTATKNLYYPVNIRTCSQQREYVDQPTISPYIIQSLVGVPGWTRIIIPI